MMVADLVRSGSQRLRLVLATANPDKAAEIAAILAGSPIDLEARPISLTEVAETGDTLEENARIKALAVLDAFGELRSKDAGRSVDEDRSGLVAAALWANLASSCGDCAARSISTMLLAAGVEYALSSACMRFWSKFCFRSVLTRV